MGTKELLAASAIDRPAPGAGSPASFTRVLIDTLTEAKGRECTVAQLHAELTRAYYRNELTTTPIHVELSADMVSKGSLVLAPLRNGSTAVTPSERNPHPFGTSKVQLRILLAIHLSDIDKPPSVQQWTNWLSSHLPSGIEEIEVLLEELFKAFSSCFLVSMPVEVWSVLRGNPAYVYVGVISSSGMMHRAGDVSQGTRGFVIRDTRKENLPMGGRFASRPSTK